MAAANASLGDLRTWTHHVILLSTLMSNSLKPRCTLHMTDQASLTNQLHTAVLLKQLRLPPSVTTLPTFYGTCRFKIPFTAARHLSQSSASRIHSTFSNPTSSWSSLITTLPIMPRYWNFRNRFFDNPLANVFSDFGRQRPLTLQIPVLMSI